MPTTRGPSSGPLQTLGPRKKRRGEWGQEGGEGGGEVCTWEEGVGVGSAHGSAHCAREPKFPLTHDFAQ